MSNVYLRIVSFKFQNNLLNPAGGARSIKKNIIVGILQNLGIWICFSKLINFTENPG